MCAPIVNRLAGILRYDGHGEDCCRISTEGRQSNFILKFHLLVPEHKGHTYFRYRGPFTKYRGPFPCSIITISEIRTGVVGFWPNPDSDGASHNERQIDPSEKQ